MIERYDPNAGMNYEELEPIPQYADQFHGHNAPPEPATEGEEGYIDPSAELGGDEPANEAPRPRSRRAHKVAWWSSMVVTGGVLGLAIVGIMKFVNDPAEATGKTISGVQSPSPQGQVPSTSQLVGLNFEFTYPGKFDQLRQVKDNSGSVEAYTLSSKSNYRHTAAVEVRTMQPGGLKEDASYRLRQLKAADYKESTEKVNGEPISEMTKADKTEATLFWPHGDKLLTVSVTTSDTNDDVAAMLEVMKMSTRWNK